MSRLPPSAAATRSRSASGAQAMSASVNRTYLCWPLIASRPCAIAQTLPAQTLPAPPGSRGLAVTTCSGQAACPAIFAAISPVPSELPSSTRMTLNAPGYSCLNSVGKAIGTISASSRAGTIATTSGHRPGSPRSLRSRGLSRSSGSRWSVRQYPPCATSRYTQMPAASPHATLNPSTPAASHTQRTFPTRPAAPLSPNQATPTSYRLVSKALAVRTAPVPTPCHARPRFSLYGYEGDLCPIHPDTSPASSYQGSLGMRGGAGVVRGGG